MHEWLNYVMYCSQIVTLSGDQSEVFEYLVRQYLLLTAYFRKSDRQKAFLFQYLSYTVWLLCVLKLFHFGEGKNSTRQAL